MTTPRLSIDELTQKQASKYLTINEALQVVDGLVQAVALTTDNTEYPASPNDGDVHIVNGNISQYYNGSWTDYTPHEGWRIYAKDKGYTVLFDGSNWVRQIPEHTQHNYSATADPTSNDDSSVGYTVGSEWVNVDTDIAYKCIDATQGSAIWEQMAPSDTTSSSGGVTSAIVGLVDNNVYKTEYGKTYSNLTNVGSADFNLSTIITDGFGTYLALGSYNDNCYIYRSTDKGVSWDVVSDGVDSGDARGGDFNGNTVLVLDHNGNIHKSTDLGLTWTFIDTSMEGTDGGICYDALNDKWFVIDSSDPGHVYYSTDAGETWTDTGSSTSFKWGNCISSGDATVDILVAGDDNGVYTSTDGGASWTHALSTSRMMNVGYDSTHNTFILVGYYGRTAISRDNGSTWEEVIVSGNDMRGVFYSSLGLWILGDDEGQIFTSSHTYGWTNHGDITGSNTDILSICGLQPESRLG